MRISRIALAVFSLFLLICPSLAENWNVTGTWESEYQFGSVKEIMTANIQQVGENLLGSFRVKPDSGEGYSGIIFGTVNGDKVEANYLSVRSSDGKDPQVTITFTDGRIVDRNTIKGTYYVQDSDMNAISGQYKALRK